MKTTIYLLIGILLFGIIAMGFTTEVKAKNTILVQAIEKNVSSDLLNQSAAIISNRLKSISSGQFDVEVIPGKNQIKVTLPDDVDLPAVESLLIQKGALEFYETYNRKQISEIIPDSQQLFSMLNPVSADHSDIIIGCKPITELDKINAYVNSAGLNQKIKFAWGQSSEGGEAYLYALKSANVQSAFPAGSDIESVKYSLEQGSKDYSIGITFKKSGAGLWYEATKRNMNHSIAIVLDNKVIYAPKVKSEISGGVCSITGDFTEVEARSFAALLNNGVLPVDFRLVK